MSSVKQLISKMKKRFTRERVIVESPAVNRRISRVLKEREKRAKIVFKTTLGGVVVGIGFSLLDAKFNPSPEMKEALKNYFINVLGTGVALGIGAQSDYLQPLDKKGRTINQRIRKATYYVGRELAVEAKRNHDLRAFLEKHRYIYIDRKGKITGADKDYHTKIEVAGEKKTIGIGYVRLSSRRILENRF